MVTTVTIPVALGGTNVGYNDGTGAYGMKSSNGYGYATYFLPLMSEVVAACAVAVNSLSNSGAVSMWVTGTTYALGNVVWSPTDFQNYRKITASSVSSTDPSADATNWRLMTAGPNPTFTTLTVSGAVTTGAISADIGNSNGGVALSLNSSYTAGTIAVFKNSGTTFGYIGSANNLNGGSLGDLALRTAGAHLDLGGAGAVWARLASTGLTVNGQANVTSNLVLNNGTYIGWGALSSLIYADSSTDTLYLRTNGIPQLTVNSSGNVALQAGQLSFPATQNSSSNANTLDDYEEGTFTPTITFGGGSTGITYAAQVGRYTKIGDLVTCVIRVALSNKGSSTGQALIQGLPFTTLNVSNLFQSGAHGPSSNITLAGNITGYSDPNVTYVVLSDNAAGVPSALSDTQFTNTSALMLTLTYKTAT